jgi:hypothetical protein
MTTKLDTTLEYLQSRLVSAVLRSPSMQHIADMSQRMAETAGIVAGTMIARRVKECCETCATPEGIAVTIHDMVTIFKSKLEEAAHATAQAIGSDEVSVRKGIELHDNPTADVKAAIGETMQRQYIDFVMDKNGFFMDVDDENGKSFCAGEMVWRPDGNKALRVRPEVFNMPEPAATDEKDDPIAAAIARGLSELFGGEVKVITGSSPIDVVLQARGIKADADVLKQLEEANKHRPVCRCKHCLLWWAYAGPNEVAGDYGPFTKVEVNAKQRELKLEETA